MEYGSALSDSIKKQGFYLVREHDLCGNEQYYIVYIDLAPPAVSIRVATGDGGNEEIEVTPDWLQENSATMYYLSFDIIGVNDNIDEYYVLTAQKSGTTYTCLQGEELPNIEEPGEWTISVYDRAGNVMQFTFYIASNDPYWTYSSLDGIKQVTFYFRTSEQYNALTSIEIFKAGYDGTEVKLEADDNGTPIGASTTTYVFTVGGKYIARVIDMFGRTVELGPVFYTKGLPRGTLSGVSNSGTTNGDVTFVYSDSYELTTYIYDGGEWIIWSEDNYQSDYSASTGNHTAVFTASVANCYDYMLFLSNKLDNNLFIEYTFRIDCIMADFAIYTEEGEAIPFSEDMSTNKPFYVTWTEDGMRVQYSTTSVFSKTYTRGSVINSDGRYSFTLKDYAGNTASFSVLLDTKVSYEVKAISGGIKEQNGVYYSAYPVTVTVKELFRTFAVTSSNGLTCESGTPITEDGRYDIDIVDYYGNTAHVTIVIDSIPPSYTLEGVTNSGVTNQPVTISFTDDVASAVRISTSGAIMGDIASGQVFTEEGSYTLRLQDEIGNTVIVIFTIDNSVNFTSSVLSGQVTSQPVQIKLNEGGVIAVNDVEQSGTIITITQAGEYSVRITDGTGNASQLYFVLIPELYRTFDYSFTPGTTLLSATKDGQAFDVALAEGRLVLDVTGKYELSLQNGSATYVLSVTVDNTPAEIVIEEGEDGSVTLSEISKSNVTILCTKDGEQIACDVGTTFTDNGKYKIVVTDELGNVAEISFDIPYKMSTISIIVIVIGAVAVIAAIIVIIIKRRKIKS